MHWIQEEKPVEYHVVRWDNSAFHNHDRRPGRKMLGGVSFDGGGGGKNANIQQTGVQAAQPSFSHTMEEGWPGGGLAKEGLRGLEDSLHGERKGKGANVLRAAAGSRVRTVQGTPAALKPDAGNAGNMAGAEAVPMSVPEEGRKRFAILKSARKLGSRVQTFLQGMQQRAGREHSGKSPDKEETGRKSVTKEEFEQMRTEQSYLLDSYNKYGERSTLGK